MSRLSVVAFAAVILSAMPAPAAPPLAQYVPADAHIYIGWAGIQSPAPGYDESHLKPIIDASGLPQVIDQFIPALTEFVANQNPEDAETFRQTGAFIESMIRYPVAIYVGPRPTDDPDASTPSAVICRPGDAEPQLVQQFQDLIRQAPLDGPPMTLHHHDTGIVALSFDDPSPAFDALFSGIASPDAPPPARLADHPPFKAAVTAKHPAPVFAGWCDINAIIGLIDYNNLERFTRLDDADPRKQLADQWPKFRDALGLNGIEYLTFTAGFDDGNWLMQSTLQAPAPRQGLGPV